MVKEMARNLEGRRHSVDDCLKKRMTDGNEILFGME